VVLHTRQYLTALMPLEDALVLVKLRWPAEVRGLATLELGPTVTKPNLAKSELEMARRLIEDMAGDWQPEEYRDQFQEQIMDLVEEKAQKGKIHEVEAVSGEAETRRSADVIDLTELLKRSLSERGAEAKGKGKSDDDEQDKPAAPKRRAPRKQAR
jgi:DNA end-binding protein Ku